MKPFPITALLTYLGELIRIDPTESHEFENMDALKEVDEFMTHPKDEWDIMSIGAEQILELFIMEAILNSRVEHLVDQNIEENEEAYSQFYQRYWGGDFSKTFFDPAPNPSYSLAGWINYNYCKQYYETHEKNPPQSLHHVYQLVHALVDKSPTCDETILEYTTEIFLEAENGEDPNGFENGWDWLTVGGGNDVIYELSKTLLNHSWQFGELLQTPPDTLTHDLGLLLHSDIQDDFIDTFESILEPEEILLTPIALIRSWCDMIDAKYLN